MKAFIRKRDMLIIAFILSAAIAAELFIKSKARSDDCFAVITVNNEVVETVNLNEALGVFTIEGIPRICFEINGKGEIRIVSSDCRDKICIHTGFISRPNEVIICLPEKLTVKITGTPENNYDAVIG